MNDSYRRQRAPGDPPHADPPDQPARTNGEEERTHDGDGSALALDERQRRAVAAPPGPVLIVAGAGSGKTRVLTARAAALARRSDLGPQAVLVITFTNRAAAELRERLERLIGTGAGEAMTIGTFHAVCHRMLRSHARRAGRTPGFSVYDRQASVKLVAAAVAELGHGQQLGAEAAAELIGRAKARLLGPEDCRELTSDADADAAARAYAGYEQRLARADALDFDDLLVRAVGLLGAPDLREHYRRRWRAVCVDEYQDTNPAQDELLRRLTAAKQELSVVGDDDQAVYGWRSAEVANILGFEASHPGTRVVALERNYRSSGAIVAAAARLVAHNTGRRDKTMWTPAADGLAVAAISCADDQKEAELAAGWCRALIARGREPGEIAVLFRTRRQARALEDGLLGAGVVCRVVGAQGLWDSAAVRDLVAHLALLCNPRDTVALSRALRCQPGVGPAAVARVLGAAEHHGGDLVATCLGAATIAGLRGGQAGGVEAFGQALRGLARTLTAEGVAACAGGCVTELGIAERLCAERSQHGVEQLDRLRRFWRSARRYEQETEEPRLAEFLAQAALSAGEDADEATGVVTLATLHAAKGAEWDHVRIVGLCEGLLPHRRAVAANTVAEERRLAYVGMTRARHELVLSWPGVAHGEPRRASRFLAEAGLLEGAVDEELRRARAA